MKEVLRHITWKLFYVLIASNVLTAYFPRLEEPRISGGLLKSH